MSWKAIKKEYEELEGKIVFRETYSEARIYIPAGTRRRAKITGDCYCRINRWESKGSSENHHKLFIQFFKKEHQDCRRVHHGSFVISKKIAKEYTKNMKIPKRIVIPVVTDKCNMLLDLRDLQKEEI